MIALLWWNLVTVPPPEATAPSARGLHRGWVGARERVKNETVNAVLGGYVRAATLWQRWYLFAPDPPRYGPKLRIYGVREVPGGHVLDPEPLFEVGDVALDDHRLMLASPPCGFEVSDDPRAAYLAAAFTRWVVQHRVQATGYVGARLTCTVWPLPGPDGGPPAFAGPGEDIVLWEGPL
jgi:hypothetical protein